MLQVQVRKAGATACTPLPPPSPPLPNPALFACFQAAFALFDVPEAIAVLRTSICALTPLTRLEALAYYMGEAGGGGRGRRGEAPTLLTCLEALAYYMGEAGGRGEALTPLTCQEARGVQVMRFWGFEVFWGFGGCG